MTAADIGGMKHYPQVIQESGQRPDAVMESKKIDTIIVAELTVPWEDRMEQRATFSKKIGILNSRWTSLTKGIECTSLPSKLEQGDWWVGSVTPSLERLAYQVERGTKLWNECRRLPKRLPTDCGQNETANSMSPLSSQW